MEIGELENIAKECRRDAIEAIYKAGSGHPGSALSMMEVLVSIYFGGFFEKESDRVILSAGHVCPGQYAVLARAGYFDREKLWGLRKLNEDAQGHPHRGALPGVEISSGSLGQGLSVGIGLAYAMKKDGKNGKIYVLMSDGEQEEGSTWEALMLAPKLKLDNLVAVVDKNGMQIDGKTEDVMPSLDPLEPKYEAFGWNVKDVNGHDMGKVNEVLQETAPGKPTIIVSHTVRGKGVSYMEHSDHWHAGNITDEQFETAMSDLES